MCIYLFGNYVIADFRFVSTFFLYPRRRKRFWMHVCDTFNFFAMFLAELYRSSSMTAFIWSSSTTTGCPERSLSFNEKSPERNFANQFWHWRSFKASSPYTAHNFLWAFEALTPCFIKPCENKKAKCGENARFDSPYSNFICSSHRIQRWDEFGNAARRICFLANRIGGDASFSSYATSFIADHLSLLLLLLSFPMVLIY